MFAVGGRVKVATNIRTGWRDERVWTDEMRAGLDRRRSACDVAVAGSCCWAIGRKLLDLLQPSGARAEHLMGPHAVGTGRP